MIKVAFLNNHKNKEGQYTGDHSHNCFEIIYYRKGSGRTTINGKEYDFSEHCLAFVRPHTVHNELDVEYTEPSFIGFEWDGEPEIAEGLYQIKNSMVIERIFDTVFSEITKQKRGYELLVSSKLYELLIYLYRADTDEVSNAKDLGYCMRYIEENYGNAIDFRSLAALYGYSYDYFRHIFKETCGFSPQNYLMQQRLINAEEMLRNTNMNCTAVAEKCGFSNIAQFSSLFKKRFGIAPKSYSTSASAKRIH